MQRFLCRNLQYSAHGLHIPTTTNGSSFEKRGTDEIVLSQDANATGSWTIPRHQCDTAHADHREKRNSQYGDNRQGLQNVELASK